MVVERVNPCLRPLRATGLKSPVPTKGGMGEQPFLCFEDNHTASASPLTRGLQRGILLHAYLSQPPQIGGRGLCSHRPLSVLRQFSRGLSLTLVAIGWDSNPRFPPYEGGDLATSLPRNINYFSLTFYKYYIIFFTKVQNLKKKDFGSLWVYQPWPKT